MRHIKEDVVNIANPIHGIVIMVQLLVLNKNKIEIIFNNIFILNE
jgi:hypothetical protein